MASVPEITPREVKKMIDEKKAFVLIDVREPQEFQGYRIPGSRLIPLGELPGRMNELNPADEIVVHCKSGQRSAKAAELLMKAGFRKIRNMTGGILAWSKQVEPLAKEH